MLENQLKNYKHSPIKFEELNESDINKIFKELTSIYKIKKFKMLLFIIFEYTTIAITELTIMAELAIALSQTRYPYKDYPYILILQLILITYAILIDESNKIDLQDIKKELERIKQQDIEYLQNNITDISKDFNTNKVLYKHKSL